jgi:hypothetical protein
MSSSQIWGASLPTYAAALRSIRTRAARHAEHHSGMHAHCRRATPGLLGPASWSRAHVRKGSYGSCSCVQLGETLSHAIRRPCCAPRWVPACNERCAHCAESRPDHRVWRRRAWRPGATSRPSSSRGAGAGRARGTRELATIRERRAYGQETGFNALARAAANDWSELNAHRCRLDQPPANYSRQGRGIVGGCFILPRPADVDACSTCVRRKTSIVSLRFFRRPARARVVALYDMMRTYSI